MYFIKEKISLIEVNLFFYKNQKVELLWLLFYWWSLSGCGCVSGVVLLWGVVCLMSLCVYWYIAMTVQKKQKRVSIFLISAKFPKIAITQKYYQRRK